MKKEDGYSEAYESALRLAIAAHRHQARKGSGLPYIVHPIHVSVILLRHGFSTEAAIAGLLHDIVEDQGYDLEEIDRRFGPRVAEMVDALSERKRDAHGGKRAWKVRKREALGQIQGASQEAVAVKAADALHNAQSFVEDLQREGPKIWQHFNEGPAPQLDYYRRIVEISRERLGLHPLVEELKEAVQGLGRTIGETGS
jgi:GTP pyrophosphokinase